MVKMKVFVINLDRNPERLKSVTGQLAALGIEFERIVAVDGRAEARRPTVREFLVNAGFLTPGERGCAMSHLKVCERMIRDGLPMAAVFEDDVRLGGELPRVLAEIADFMSDELPRVVLLNAHGCDERKRSGIERISTGFCTDGYALNLAAARLVVRLNRPVCSVADSWRRWIARGGLNLHRAWPTTVTQAKDVFALSETTPGYRPLRGLRLWLHRVVKVVLLPLDWLWWRLADV